MKAWTNGAGLRLGKVARGAATITAANLIVRTIGFFNTLILARLLSPDQFGVVAIGFAVSQLLVNMSDIGVSRTVIRFREAGKAEYDTLFTLSLIRGLVVGGVLLAISHWAGVFYDDPRVKGVFVMLAGIALIESVINPRFYEFERNLDYSREFLVSTVVKLSSVIVSIGVAIAFRSYWAIIVGLMTGSVVKVTLSYVVIANRPRLSLAAFRKIIGFSGGLAVLSTFVSLNNKLELLIVGRAIGPAGAGQFYMGDQLAFMPSTEVALPITRAVFPKMSELEADSEQMNEAYLGGVEALALLTLPASFGVAFVAGDFVDLFLGVQWRPVVHVLQFLAPVYGLMAIFQATENLGLAKGRIRPILFREISYFFLRVPALVIGSFVYGLNGAIYAAAGTGLIYIGLQAQLFGRLTGANPLLPLFRARRSLLATGAMGIWFFGLRPFLPVLDDLPTVTTLLIDLLAGASLYLGTVYGLWMAEGQPGGAERSVLSMLPGRPR